MVLLMHLKKLGFLQSNSCIYVAAIDELMVVGVYVDYLVIRKSS